jgi:hypothetical protein
VAPRRRYTKREKVAAVLAADASSTLAAAEATGIPESTLRYWLDRPEFANLRENAREGIAEDALMVARLAWKKLGQAIADGTLEPRDLVIATGMATDKSQLLNGGATARTEARDLTGTISDAELDAAIREANAIATGGGSPEAPTEPAEG